MEQIRSFIAIELPGELRLELGQLEAQLKSGGHSSVKWVNPNNIHLTLKFLGNIAADRTGEITRAIEEAAQGIRPFHLEVRELGAFPSLKRAQVVWVGIRGAVDTLGRLHQGIESALARLGFGAESRPFTAHLTLARLQDRATPTERQKFGELVASTRFAAASTVSVDAVSLMRSQLTRDGAIYSRIGSVRLENRPPTAST